MERDDERDGSVRWMRFGPLRIAYDEKVLRPRPWTLLQAQWAHRLSTDLPPGDVLELCAGVGHIGLAAVHGTDRRLLQVDADERACELARRNARDAGLADRVEVVRADLAAVASELPAGRLFPLVVADPPWVSSEDIDGNPADPDQAIDGGADGLELVRACVGVLGERLADGGAALVQVGGIDQVAAVAEHVRRLPELDLDVVEHRLARDGSQGAVVCLRRRR